MTLKKGDRVRVADWAIAPYEPYFRTPYFGELHSISKAGAVVFDEKSGKRLLWPEKAISKAKRGEKNA